MQLFDFEKIVVSVANRVRVRNQEVEDIKQSLWLKVMETLPKLQAVPAAESYRLCRAVLSNHAIDLYRKESGYRQNNKRDVVPMSALNSRDGEIMDGIRAIMGAYDQPSALDLVEQSQLKPLILKWASTQTYEISKFLCELVNPSLPTIKIHEGMVARQVRKTDIDFVSPHHLRQIMGVSGRKWRAIQIDLQDFLRQNGYDQNREAYNGNFCGKKI